MTEPCPGACNAAYRRGAGSEPTMGEDGSPWCRADQARIRRLLAELDDVACLLTMQADGHREQGTELGRNTSHAPSPSPAADDIDLLWRTLYDWECAYRDDQEWPTAPRRGVLASVLTSTIAWQLAHLSGMLAAPFAADYGQEVAQWHRRLVAQGKLGTGRHRKPVRCPRCQELGLTWSEGDDYVVCGLCGRMLSMDEYHEEARASLERAS